MKATRPRNAMPQGPVPPVKGSNGRVTLVTRVNLGEKSPPNRGTNNPGPMTAPSAQGPTRGAANKQPKRAWDQ